MIKLSDQLAAHDCKVDAGEFVRVVVGHFAAKFRRHYSTEELLHRPTEAIKFCEQVRKKLRSSVPDPVILRTLTNARKRSKIPAAG